MRLESSSRTRIAATVQVKKYLENRCWEWKKEWDFSEIWNNIEKFYSEKENKLDFNEL